MSNTKPSFPYDSSELIIQVEYFEKRTPFICGVSGPITLEVFEQIEEEVEEVGEDGFTHGDGDYLFKATLEPGQQTFPETGQWDYPPYWQLDFIEFRSIQNNDHSK